jgi:hypothetical protein
VKFEVMAEGGESLGERKARAKRAIEARMTLYKEECKSAGLEIMHTGARLRLPSGGFVLKEGGEIGNFLRERRWEVRRIHQEIVLREGCCEHWKSYKICLDTE